MPLVFRPDGFTAYGVDGCRGGWFAVSLKPCGTAEWRVVASLGDLVKVAEDTDRIFVDIPIGLPNGPMERQCDKKAREMLGVPRASSVFRAPVRAVMGATNYARACEISRATTQGNARGKGISKQTFAIVPKIREVDSLLRDSPKARRLVREVHPEVCFRALAGRPMKYSKKKKAGLNERREVLLRAWPCVDSLIDEVMAGTLRKQVARDDILDAAVAALTACQDAKVLRSLPEERVEDECGMPMQMVYACQNGD